ncbi:MAG: hypothetical protein ACI4V2_00740 [Alloprevotella sp.]
MSSSENRNNWLANAFSVVGFCLLAVATYFGHFYLSLGAISGSILWAALTVVVGLLLLYWLVVVKQKDTDLSRWHLVEGILVGVYVAFAVLTVKGPLHFVSVLTAKAELQQAGRDDVQSLQRMMADYERFEHDAIDRTYMGLMGYLNCQTVSQEAGAWLGKMKIDCSEESIERFLNKTQREPLLGKSYAGMKQTWDEQTRWLGGVVESWSLFRLPYFATEVEQTGAQMAKALTELSESAQLPVMSLEGSRLEMAEANQVYQPAATEGRLAQQLQTVYYGCVWGWVVWLVLHLLILMSYFLAHRSDRVSIKYTPESGTVL